jgi:hypothetical protein
MITVHSIKRSFNVMNFHHVPMPFSKSRPLTACLSFILLSAGCGDESSTPRSTMAEESSSISFETAAEQAVENTLSWLTWDRIKGSNSSSKTGHTATSPLDLTLTGCDGATISWSSDQSSYLSPTGLVRRGLRDIDVTLTATISKGDSVKTKTFFIKVLALPPQRELKAEASLLARVDQLTTAYQQMIAGTLIVSGFETPQNVRYRIIKDSTQQNCDLPMGTITHPATGPDTLVFRIFIQGRKPTEEPFTCSGKILIEEFPRQVEIPYHIAVQGVIKGRLPVVAL